MRITEWKSRGGNEDGEVTYRQTAQIDLAAKLALQL
jgi:hypothetical protein